MFGDLFGQWRRNPAQMHIINLRKHVSVPCFQASTQRRLNGESGLLKQVFSAAILALLADRKDFEDLGPGLPDRSIQDHPFPRLMRFGIPVCLNTDDRGMWGSTMTDEYFLAVKNFNLSWAELTRLGRNSLEYSFAQPNEKQQMIDSSTAAVQRFESRYSGDWKSAVASVNATGSPYAAREFGIKLPEP
jgi:Adenosine deaminase